MNKKIEWWIISIIGVVAFVLGMFGYNTYFIEQETHRHFIDLIFHTIKLFGFEIVDEYASPLPLPLEIARFLAPGIVLYTAIKGILFLVRREIKYMQMKSYKNHIVVSSINSYSRFLIKDLINSNEKIILVTEDDDISAYEDYERDGVIVVRGSLTDQKVLKNISASKAKQIILLNENDEQNISTAISAFNYLKGIKTEYETIIYTHISDYNKLNEIKEISLFDKVVGEHEEKFNYEMQIFSMNERSSRLVFNKFSPDQFRPIKSIDSEQPHIVVVGSNEFTQSLIIHFAKLCHFINKKKLKVSLFHQNHKFIKKLDQTFPSLRDIIDLNDIEVDLDLFNSETVEQINREQKLSGIYLTCRDDELSLSILNKLTRINFSDSLDVVLTLIKPQGVLSRWYPNGQVKNLRVHKFNIVEETFTKEALLSEDVDKLAKIIHNDYISDQKKENKLDRKKKASHREWEFLPIDFKEQNRLQADHIWVKLRGVEINPKSDFTFEDNDELVEQLSEIEHNRWTANMLLNGWKVGNKRDDANKIHTDLISYNELSEEVKQYDRNTILNIPKLVKTYFKK
jgi:hypothetical protein